MYFQFTSHLQLVAFNEKTEFYQEIVLCIPREGERGICKATVPFNIIASFKIKLSKKLIIKISNNIRKIVIRRES